MTIKEITYFWYWMVLVRQEKSVNTSWDSRQEIEEDGRPISTLEDLHLQPRLQPIRERETLQATAYRAQTNFLSVASQIGADLQGPGIPAWVSFRRNSQFKTPTPIHLVVMEGQQQVNTLLDVNRFPFPNGAAIREVVGPCSRHRQVGELSLDMTAGNTWSRLEPPGAAWSPLQPPPVTRAQRPEAQSRSRAPRTNRR